MESITDREADFDPDLIDLHVIIDVPVISNSIEERTTNHTIKNLSADNDHLYIEHDKVLILSHFVLPQIRRKKIDFISLFSIFKKRLRVLQKGQNNRTEKAKI